MNATLRIARVVWLGAALPLLAAPGCVDNDEDGAGPALDAAFVGYTNPDTKQTTCGNCHISKQRSWVRTAHARAWDDLQGSGQAQVYCERCHTTSGFGNAAPDSAGFPAAGADAKRFYYDVQCESCHGPGAGHIAAPDDAQPLSTIVADTAAVIGCATCHTGTHNPFVEEWRSSRHGIVNAYPAGRVADGCATCHEGRQAIRRYDPDARFLEQSSTVLQPITCAVCHDPHGGPNASQLRAPIDVADDEVNLCMTCHHKRSVPDPTTTRGAHSPQGPMLLGEAGWIPQDFAYDATRQASTHGSTANPRLCAGCHVERYTVTDAATGQFLVNSVGHSFRAIPCVDANGRPTGAADCPDTERRFNACTSSGCHSSASVAMGARQVLAARLQGYIDVLWKDKDNDGALDPLPTDSGLLAQVRQQSASDFSATGTGATVITVGEGVFFNTDMIKRGDGSMGVHNPFYAEALLLASTQALRQRYTYLPAPPLAGRARLASRVAALGMRLP